jgi:hypothetical protein
VWKKDAAIVFWQRAGNIMKAATSTMEDVLFP